MLVLIYPKIDILSSPPMSVHPGDVVVFSGDCSNPRNPYENEPEVRDFLKWFSGLEIPHKIMIAGNHDSSIERGLVDKKTIEALGIHYLFNSSVTISGVNFWGSPYTPTFGQWSFNMSRAKLDRVWQSIPENTDVVIILLRNNIDKENPVNMTPLSKSV